MAIQIIENTKFNDSIKIYGDLIVEGDLHVHGNVKCGKDVIAYAGGNVAAFASIPEEDIKYFRNFHISNQGVHINGKLLTKMTEIIAEIRETMNALDDNKSITSMDQLKF